MQVLIYVGLAPSRDLVIEFSAQIVQIASAVTLVTGGGRKRQALLDDAASRLHIPANVPVKRWALDGNPQVALLTAARKAPHDLVILGRLNPPVRRLLSGARSKVIAQSLEPSVLRVQGLVRPINRILVASGGDRHTFQDVHITAQLAAPLKASVTILHVISQQSLVFEGLVPHHLSVGDFLAGNSPEATTLRKAAAILQDYGITSEIKGRVGPIVDEILDELRTGGFDLLVIGAHQVASVLDRILFEDITGDLLDLGLLPVLVAKGNQEG